MPYLPISPLFYEFYQADPRFPQTRLRQRQKGKNLSDALLLRHKVEFHSECN